jgi:hypothetical protein
MKRFKIVTWEKWDHEVTYEVTAETRGAALLKVINHCVDPIISSVESRDDPDLEIRSAGQMITAGVAYVIEGRNQVMINDYGLWEVVRSDNEEVVKLGTRGTMPQLTGAYPSVVFQNDDKRVDYGGDDAEV